MGRVLMEMNCAEAGMAMKRAQSVARCALRVAREAYSDLRIGIIALEVALEALNRRLVAPVTLPSRGYPLPFYRERHNIRATRNEQRATHGQTRSPPRHSRPPDPQ